MIVITTVDALPDHCYECPCQDGESGYCQADKEHRYSDYRPYWCPLKDVKMLRSGSDNLKDNMRRIKDMFKAMEICLDAGKPIPREWIDTLQELIMDKR